MVISWQREFRTWHYTVSYSQLLLRSLNAEAQPRRIDLLFSNVEYMRIDAEYDQLAIEEISSSDPRLGESAIQPKYGKIFLVNGGPHLVIATHCQWHEDDGGAHSASQFGPLRGIE